ncbi:PAS domain S-box protein [Halorientalis salina]|uniref:PAS domain S-box protein n=1 Tax=Halorientalis salina TaxID=2932266 RepID=UPI0010AD1A3F|nr:PAS domain S-box protein [Halorientalis salina]
MSDGADDRVDRESVVSSGPTRIRVLHVDDEPSLGETAALWLEKTSEHLSVVTETSAPEALDRLAEEPIDCIVSDYDMPGMNGLEFLEAVRESDPDLPFILFTGKGSEEIASEAISAGVTDYLQKEVGTDQYTVLANRIERAVGEQRTADALEESERVLSTLMSNLPGMVYRCRNEPDWPMEFVSDGSLDISGYSKEALTAGAITYAEDVIHPDDRQEVWDAVQAAIEEGVPYKLEYRIETKQGDIRWVWEQGRAVDTADDGTAVLEGVVTDITEQKEREGQLRQAKQRYRRVVEQDLFGIYIIRNGVIEYINPKAASIFGYTPEELTDGMTAFDIVAEADHDRLRENIRRREQGDVGQLQYELTGVRKDGSRFDFEVHSGVIEYEGEPALLGALVDITDRKERERELEQYETMIETVGDGVYVADEDLEFVTVNDAMTDLTGYDRDRLVGSSATLVLSDADVEHALAVRDELRTTDRDVGSLDINLQTADGESRPCEVRFRILTDDDGTYRGTAGVVRDITERRQYERELERQNERLDEFASVVSHDLRGPLTVARERTELLHETGEDLHYRKARSAFDRMDDLIEDVLELARQGRVVEETEPVAIESVAREVWSTIRTGESTLSVSTDASVVADRNRLYSLFENLLRNAVEHGSTSPDSQARQDAVEHGATGSENSESSGDGVTVTVGLTTGSRPSTPDGAKADPAGFYVADDGPGIPPDERDRVFEASYSTTEEGTGFGLDIVETIADAHGWSVSVSESDGGGARFTVSGVDIVAPDETDG